MQTVFDRVKDWVDKYGLPFAALTCDLSVIYKNSRFPAEESLEQAITEIESVREKVSDNLSSGTDYFKIRSISSEVRGDPVYLTFCHVSDENMLLVVLSDVNIRVSAEELLSLKRIHENLQTVGRPHVVRTARQCDYVGEFIELAEEAVARSDAQSISRFVRCLASAWRSDRLNSVRGRDDIRVDLLISDAVSNKWNVHGGKVRFIKNVSVPMVYKGDRDVFGALVDHMIDFSLSTTPDGWIYVGAAFVAGDMARLEIVDCGQGSKYKDSFFFGSCEVLADRLEGKLQVAFSEGAGTTMRFTFSARSP